MSSPAGRAEAPPGRGSSSAADRGDLRIDRSVVATRWSQRDRISRRALLVSDMVGILLALYIGAAIAGYRDQPVDLLVLALPTIPAWALLFKLYGLYDRDVKRISHSGVDDVPWLFHALVIGMLGLWAYAKFVPETRITFAEALWFGVVGLLLLVLLRSLMRRQLIGRMGAERLLIAGAGATSALLVRKIVQHPEYGLTPVGRIAPTGAGLDDVDLTADAPAARADRPIVPLLGTSDDLARLLERGGIERVILCRSDLEAPDVLRMARVCHRYGAKVGIVPGATDAYGPSVELDEVEGVTVLGVNRPMLGRSSRWLKRAFDICGAMLALLVTSPLLVAIAVAIKLDSRGPVLYRQKRIGRRGRRFVLIKFRTMVPDADGQRGALMSKSSDPNWLHLESDPRVTRLGSLLRKTSLDELPQLWNVLGGSMSLVGPRPLPEEEDARVNGWARGRLDLTPGITGLWQVLGRTSIPFEEMVKLDYVYVTNWSVWMDIRLLVRTLPAVLHRRGAN